MQVVRRKRKEQQSEQENQHQELKNEKKGVTAKSKYYESMQQVAHSGQGNAEESDLKLKTDFINILPYNHRN